MATQHRSFRLTSRLLRLGPVVRPALLPHPRHRHVSGSSKNRIFNPVRSVEEFDTVLLLSASARTPLLALFTASWCPSCKTVAPLLRELVGDDGVGESHGGVAYAEIESDAPDVAGLAGRYVVTSLPTLMAFSRQEPQMATRLAAVRDLTDRGFLTAWIEREATRGGAGGAGGASGPFGAIASLFGR